MRRTNPFNLTDKQVRFVEFYVTSRDLIAAEAYRKAYPNCKSKAAARASASRLLRTNPAINAYIQDIGKKCRF